MGSAALSLAYLACGRIDGFWAKGLFSWDIAAGIILVEEAGGEVSDFFGEDFKLDGKIIIASNAALHNQLVENL